MLEKIAYIIHEYNKGCKIEVESKQLCPNCKYIAKQVCFTISEEFKSMFLGRSS